jgi:hypothetical protein
MKTFLIFCYQLLLFRPFNIGFGRGFEIAWGILIWMNLLAIFWVIIKIIVQPNNL